MRACFSDDITWSCIHIHTVYLSDHYDLPPGDSPSLGDVATSTLRRPTRRMCNQSTGHRGGQVRSAAPFPYPSPAPSPFLIHPDLGQVSLMAATQCQGHWLQIASGKLQVAGCGLQVAICRLQVAACPFDRHQRMMRPRTAALEGVITFLLKPPQRRCCLFLCYFIAGSRGAKWKTPMKIKARFRRAQKSKIYIVHRPRWQF